MDLTGTYPGLGECVREELCDLRPRKKVCPRKLMRSLISYLFDFYEYIYASVYQHAASTSWYLLRFMYPVLREALTLTYL